MSVTFYLRSGETSYPSCPACGGSMGGDKAPDRDCKHPDCMGYGPDPVDSTPSMNLANVNARAFLRFLDVEGGDDLCGTLDPEDVKLRLALVTHRPLPTRPTVQRGNVIDCGLDAERIQSYVESLSVLAEIAARRREPILFG